MNADPEARKPKYLENSLLLLAGLLAHAPLLYQLPRLVKGLEPTFVHPRWIEHSPFPLFFYMAEFHPLIWVSIILLVFIRICHNYGWRLEK
jgi:hypothetical protein